MAATTAAREAKHSEGRLKAVQIASATTIYKGQLVFVNASGLAVSPTDAANLKFFGVAFETVENPASGTKKVRCHKDGEFEFAYAGGDATQALVGQEVYMQDNQTVDEDAALTTNDYKVGAVQEFVSVTKLRIRIDNYVR